MWENYLSSYTISPFVFMYPSCIMVYLVQVNTLDLRALKISTIIWKTRSVKQSFKYNCRISFVINKNTTRKWMLHIVKILYYLFLLFVHILFWKKELQPVHFINKCLVVLNLQVDLYIFLMLTKTYCFAQICVNYLHWIYLAPHNLVFVRLSNWGNSYKFRSQEIN